MRVTHSKLRRPQNKQASNAVIGYVVQCVFNLLQFCLDPKASINMSKIQIAYLFPILVASSSLGLGQIPHFGNAMRNGWATQDSIVIWTRTTAQAEMTRGPDFVSVSKGLASQLLSSGEVDRLLTSQMPTGTELEQMLGSLPGLPAEVRLIYSPVDNPEKQKSTAWKKTSADQDCTAQWKLTELLPGTKYSVTAEARVPGNEQISQCVKGSSRPRRQLTKLLT